MNGFAKPVTEESTASESASQETVMSEIVDTGDWGNGNIELKAQVPSVSQSCSPKRYTELSQLSELLPPISTTAATTPRRMGNFPTYKRASDQKKTQVKQVKSQTVQLTPADKAADLDRILSRFPLNVTSNSSFSHFTVNELKVLAAQKGFPITYKSTKSELIDGIYHYYCRGLFDKELLRVRNRQHSDTSHHNQNHENKNVDVVAPLNANALLCFTLPETAWEKCEEQEKQRNINENTTGKGIFLKGQRNSESVAYEELIELEHDKPEYFYQQYLSQYLTYNMHTRRQAISKKRSRSNEGKSGPRDLYRTLSDGSDGSHDVTTFIQSRSLRQAVARMKQKSLELISSSFNQTLAVLNDVSKIEEVVLKGNAETQTDIHVASYVPTHAVTKLVSFSERKLGITLAVQSKGRQGEECSIIKSLDRHLIKNNVARVLSVGDRLVSINGVDVQSMTYTVQVKEIANCPRPVVLGFSPQ